MFVFVHVLLEAGREDTIEIFRLEIADRLSLKRNNRNR